MSHERQNNVSHRDHPLRVIQSALQGLTPDIIAYMYHRGWLDNTAVAVALSQGETLHPDHLTLAGLQITIEAAEALADNAGCKPMGRMILGGALDALDGSLARCLDLVSPEGAVKDALADRIAELYMAQLIADTRSKYGGGGADSSELKMAFQLSTLTKAASEMLGVHTSEGGQGSMIERRRKLLLILHKLGKINSSKLSDLSRSKILSEVDDLTSSLIRGSKERAAERIHQILAAPSFVQHQWNNPALDDPSSSAAIEARKYAAVVHMNQAEGLDIVKYLNDLAGGGMFFPSWEDLSQRYGYVAECIKNTEPFLESALSLAHSR